MLEWTNNYFFGLLLHAVLLSSLYPCLADLYISLLYTSYFSCLSITWFLGLANRFASLSINCYWMYFYLQSCILIVCGCNCRLLYTILCKLDVHQTFLLDTMYSNNIRTWNRDQSIFKLFLDFQLFFKLFLSFSMTGWSLFTKGGLGWRRPYIHTGWRELRNEDDWARKADWWQTLLTSTLMVPSMATAAWLFVDNTIAILILWACGDHVTYIILLLNFLEIPE